MKQVYNAILSGCLVLMLMLAAGCHRIISGTELSVAQIRYIQSLGILDSGETIYRFYSSYKPSVSGNFYSDHRIAGYWQDEHDGKKNAIHSAYYPSIKRMDTILYRGLTYAPCITVTTEDGQSFKVYFDGSHSEVRRLFADILFTWQQHRRTTFIMDRLLLFDTSFIFGQLISGKFLYWIAVPDLFGTFGLQNGQRKVYLVEERTGIHNARYQQNNQVFHASV